MTVLYVGSTTNLRTRLWEHRSKEHPESFTARYNVCRLLYFMGYHSIESARAVERQMKGKTKAWKVSLINSFNPEWLDLTDRV